MKVSLVVVQGKPEGKSINISGPKFVIGRGEKCHLRPGSDMVSKMHCSIRIQDEKVTIQDLGSTNGTFVNGDRIAGEVDVKDGDLIKIGPLVFAAKIVAEKVSKPVPAKGSSGSMDPSDDDFDILQFLTDDAAPDARPTPPSLDSTVFEFKLPEGAANTEAGPKAKYNEPEPPKPKDSTGEAADAAKALLNQLRVRKRS